MRLRHTKLKSLAIWTVLRLMRCYEIERKETRDIMRDLLKKLKVKYKEVLYLKYYEDLSVAEISARIGLPPRRVSERLNYSVKLLRKECDKANIFSILRGFVLIYVW